MEQNLPKLPPNYYSKMRCNRFYDIFNKISFTCAVLLVVWLLSIIILPLLQMTLFMLAVIAAGVIIVCTIGTVFLEPNNIVAQRFEFVGKVFDSNYSQVVIDVCIKIFPIICFVGLACAVLSIVFGALDNKSKKTRRIVAQSFICLLMVVCIAVYYIFGGALWQG